MKNISDHDMNNVTKGSQLIIGIDPGLTRTGWGVLSVSNENFFEMQFILINFIIITNLRNVILNEDTTTQSTKSIFFEIIIKTKKDQYDNTKIINLIFKIQSIFSKNIDIPSLTVKIFIKMLMNLSDTFPAYLDILDKAELAINKDNFFEIATKIKSKSQVKFFLPQYIAHGSINTQSNQSTHKRLEMIYNEISHAIEKYQPNIATLEEVFVNQANPHSALKLGSARGVILLAIAQKNLPVKEILAGKIKYSLCFKWRADKQMLKEIVFSIIGMNKKIVLDASDAIAGIIAYLMQKTD